MAELFTLHCCTVKMMMSCHSALERAASPLEGTASWLTYKIGRRCPDEFVGSITTIEPPLALERAATSAGPAPSCPARSPPTIPQAARSLALERNTARPGHDVLPRPVVEDNGWRHDVVLSVRSVPTKSNWYGSILSDPRGAAFGTNHDE